MERAVDRVSDRVSHGATLLVVLVREAGEFEPGGVWILLRHYPGDVSAGSFQKPIRRQRHAQIGEPAGSGTRIRDIRLQLGDGELSNHAGRHQSRRREHARATGRSQAPHRRIQRCSAGIHLHTRTVFADDPADSGEVGAAAPWRTRLVVFVLILVFVYHIVATNVSASHQRNALASVPKPSDLKSGWSAFVWRMTGKGEPPRYGHYTPMQKCQYWLIFLGCLLMGLSGVVLWSPMVSLSIFPKSFYDLMLVVQGANELAEAAGANPAGMPEEEITTRLERLKGSCRRVKDQALRTALAADKVLRQYPYSSIGFAFAAGLVLGAIAFWRLGGYAFHRCLFSFRRPHGRGRIH